MKLLDTVMDALNSFFPDLIRTPTSGHPSRSGMPEGTEEGAGFAATLVQFLGGRAASENVESPKEADESLGLNLPGGQEGSDGTGFMGLGADALVEWEGEPSPEGSSDPLTAANRFPREAAQTLNSGGAEQTIVSRGVETATPVDGTAAVEATAGVEGTAGVGGESNPVGPLGPTETDTAESANPQPSGLEMAAAASTSAPSAEMMDRDMGRLDPELQTRLDRVMKRMETEFGHQVRLVEGYRSPERQAELFQQGRTQPGPVVTWTRQSQHSEGRAADVQVDGSWNNPQAYARLQEIAREEGLQTLGAKDAGHLQLPEEDSGGSRAPLSLEEEWTPPKGGISRPAQVARVASPSRTARVARIARPAHPGAGRTAAPTPVPVTGGVVDTSAQDSSGPRVVELPTDAHEPEASASADGGASAESTERRPSQGSGHSMPRVDQTGLPTASPMPSNGARTREEGAGRERRDAGQRLSGVEDASREDGVLNQGWTQRAGASTPEIRGAEGVQRVGSMGRVNEIQALEDAQNARMPGRVHLDLLDADGAGTRLRLSLRGNQLSGTVDLTDPAATLRMKDRVGELHHALARRGLDATTLGLQAVRGAEAGRGIEADLAALIQDPLAGLSRILESRNGSLDTRGERQGTTGDEAQKEQGRFRNPAQRERKKEEGT